MIDDVHRFARAWTRVGGALVATPRRWGPRPWGAGLAFAGMTWLAYTEKTSLQAVVQGNGRGALQLLAVLLDRCGGGVVVTLAGCAVFVAGRWSGRRAWIETAIVLAAGGLWCWILTRIGQLVLAERRPNEGGAMELFATGGHGVSGHAAAAALLFWPVRDVLARDASPGRRRVITVALLAWAGLVAWSRVWLGMHFVWNVMLGLALGFSVGFVATHRSRALHPAAPVRDRTRGA